MNLNIAGGVSLLIKNRIISIDTKGGNRRDRGLLSSFQISSEACQKNFWGGFSKDDAAANKHLRSSVVLPGPRSNSIRWSSATSQPPF